MYALNMYVYDMYIYLYICIYSYYAGIEDIFKLRTLDHFIFYLFSSNFLFSTKYYMIISFHKQFHISCGNLE